MEPSCHCSCCCYICGWFYGSPWLSKMMQKLILLKCKCSICADFPYKFFRYSKQLSLCTYLIGDLDPNQNNTQIPDFLTNGLSIISISKTSGASGKLNSAAMKGE